MKLRSRQPVSPPVPRLKLLRLVLSCLALVVVLAALLAAAAFLPAVQTEVAQWALDRRPELHATVGSLSAGWGKLEARDLRVERGGAVLSVPALRAEFPLLPALRHRRVRVARLVAKGWTLEVDPRHAGLASALWPIAASAGILREAVNRGALPCDVSLDGADLEGDVSIAGSDGGSPIVIHVTMEGGGLASGRTGNFAVRAQSTLLTSAGAVIAVTARGDLALALDSSRTLGRSELKLVVSTDGGSRLADLALAADIGAERGGRETCRLELTRAGRALLSVQGDVPATMGRFAGTWKVDGRDDDLAALAPDRPRPGFNVQGEGRFEAEGDFSTARVVGRLNATLSRWGTVAPVLEPLGATTMEGTFEATREGGMVRVGRLDLNLSAGPLVVAVRSLQSLDFEGKTQPANGELEISFHHLPLAWLRGGGDGLALSDGMAAGRILARAQPAGWVLNSAGPLTASGVAVRGGGRTLARDLDLSLTFHAVQTGRAWQFQAAPLTVALSGRRLASADLSFRPGAEPQLDGKVTIAGSGALPAIEISPQAKWETDGTVAIFAPLRLVSSAGTSDVAVQGYWAPEGAGNHLGLKLSGPNAVAEHLGALAGLWAGDRGRDRKAFWSGWTGRLTVVLDRVQAGSEVFSDVGGILEAAGDAIRLEDGHGALGDRRVDDIEGSLAFVPDAERPYQLQATMAMGRVEAVSFFPPGASRDKLDVDGRFAVTCTVAGEGRDLADLLGRTREEFRLTSTDGILRLFRTDVNEAVPEAKTPVKDTLASVGSVFGVLLGINRESIDSGRNRVAPAAEAAIGLVYDLSEIGYDRIALAAVRDPEGAIDLTGIEVTASNLRLTGSGRIAAAPGLPLRSRPLSLDLRLGAKGPLGQRLSAAGLAAPPPDARGYTVMSQPVHLGGTLEHPDRREWHQRMVDAAREPPPAPR